MTLHDLRAGCASRAHNLGESGIEGVMPGQVMIEPAGVYVEVTAFHYHYVAAQEIVVRGLTPTRQSHHLPLITTLHIKAEIIRDRRVELTERVRQVDAPQLTDPVALAQRQQTGRGFTGAIDRENSGALER